MKRNVIMRAITRIVSLNVFHLVSDRIYLKILYWARTGYKLNLNDPKTFNEKLQWLKLYYHRPEMIRMVDKYDVKKHVASIIGEEYIIPTLGVWKRFDEINFNDLPNQFVLKCTHDSGGIVICKDKSNFDIKKARKIINKSLKYKYYYHSREWPYKFVSPRIIAEKYMVDESGVELKDYKVFNFNGEPRFIQVDYDRYNYHKRNIYSLDWEYLNVEIQFPADKHTIIRKPEGLNEMLDLAKKLSKGLPHVRTDFYSINDKIYFGEMTFYHGGGFESFNPKEFGAALGDLIDLTVLN